MDSNFSGQGVGGLGLDGGRYFGHESDEGGAFFRPVASSAAAGAKRVRVRKANGWNLFPSLSCAAWKI
jgi:hypothetical protein